MKSRKLTIILLLVALSLVVSSETMGTALGSSSTQVPGEMSLPGANSILFVSNVSPGTVFTNVLSREGTWEDWVYVIWNGPRTIAIDGMGRNMWTGIYSNYRFAKVIMFLIGISNAEVTVTATQQGGTKSVVVARSSFQQGMPFPLTTVIWPRDLLFGALNVVGVRKDEKHLQSFFEGLFRVEGSVGKSGVVFVPDYWAVAVVELGNDLYLYVFSPFMLKKAEAVDIEAHFINEAQR